MNLRHGGIFHEYDDHQMDAKDDRMAADVPEGLGDLMGELDMKKYVEGSIAFAEYQTLIDNLVAEGKTTGPNQSEKMAEYTRLNRQRMHRLAKTIEVDAGAREAIRSVKRPMIWLVITEAWCGDAAQNIPVIEKVAAESERIETRYVLRDEHPELMDRYLTNGARAVPKLIALDAKTFEILGSWGSRPAAAQALYMGRSEQGVEKSLIREELQRWYNADKGRSLQGELAGLASQWSRLPSARSAGVLLNLLLF